MIACIGLFLACSAQAYSPPENVNPNNKTLSVDAVHDPVASFTITSVDAFDYEVSVLAQAPVVFALTSDAVFAVSNVSAFALKNSYLYVLKPPLRYINVYANYISAPNYYNPFSIRKNLPQKRC
jgi:hypothetical protein